MDVQSQQQKAPRVLLGSAVTRLLRIQSLYYELVAVAVLGFVGTGAPLFGNLFFDRVPASDVAGPQRHLRHHRAGRLPRAAGGLHGRGPLLPPGAPAPRWSSPASASRSTALLYVHLALHAQRSGCAWSCSSWPTRRWRPSPSASSRRWRPPPRPRCGPSASPCSVSTRSSSAASPAASSWAPSPTSTRRNAARHASPSPSSAPVCLVGGIFLLVGSRYVRRDITLVIEDVLERYAEGKRRQAGGADPGPADPQPRLLLRHQPGALRRQPRGGPRARSWPCSGPTAPASPRCCGPCRASTIPTAGSSGIFGANCTYLEPEQIIDQGVALLVGGKMTFPGLTVRDNLRIGEHTFRRERARADGGHRRGPRGRSPSWRHGSTSRPAPCRAGEQQMLALARVMMTTPAAADDRRAGPRAWPP